MLQAKRRFDAGIERVRNLHALYIHLSATLHLPTDNVSDVLRSELAYVVSSLDKFIHDLVKEGMIETFLGRRPATNTYENFGITLRQFEAIKTATLPPPEIVFENAVVSSHKHLSFQDPDKIASVLSLIWNEPYKWKKIASCMGKTEYDIRVELKNIVIRRNQIVHEGDIDPMTSQVQAIHETDVKNSVDFIESLAHCIFSLV